MPGLELAALAYLRHVLRETKLSPSALAKKAGLSSTTLTRALNDPHHRFTLTTTTLQKIADASGINPAPFLNAGDIAQLNTEHRFRSDTYDEKTWGKSPGIPQSTVIVGKLIAGKWIEPEVVSAAEYGSIPLVHQYLEPASCFGCFVGDNSANLYAEEGDILFCLRSERMSPPERCLAIVERRDKKNFRIELTARFLIHRKDHWTLEFASTEKTFSDKIELSDLTTSPNLKIIGYVDWILRGAPWLGPARVREKSNN